MTEPSKGKEAGDVAPLHDRLWDLIRYQRGELLEAGLISQQEYADLVNRGSVSARRLESYDDLAARLSEVEAAGAEYIRRTDPVIACQTEPGPGGCGTCRMCVLERLSEVEAALSECLIGQPHGPERTAMDGRKAPEGCLCRWCKARRLVASKAAPTSGQSE